MTNSSVGYILGIDHEIQTFEGKRTLDEKKEFEHLLRKLITEHRIEFIGDETYREKGAIAKSVAILVGIHWEPIEMSLKARHELGIAEEQATMRYEPIFDGGLVVGSKHRRVLSDGIREEYMFWRTLTATRTDHLARCLCRQKTSGGDLRFC